ncbi:aminotransferase class I/II-fold pyridoxal phosphate-dependent enzyme [Candidatus Woesearchaeota archaeon]|nr:aminotransferase class I/II-fold pyridoxal phosphate-dependent enzyme [Candidatus Woesearchaeota archaeon]
MNKQAEELNNIIEKNSKAVFNLLSEKGKAIFFPAKGILAQAAEAKGKKINASIGVAIEDDGTPMRLNSIASHIDLDPKDAFFYAPSFGKKELREAWKGMIFKKNPSLKAETSLPVVTNALTHGLSIIAYLFVDPGDKIILTDKFWGNYRLVFSNGFGAELDTFNTFTEKGFDIPEFEKKLSLGQGKKIILLNFPNNPSGYTPTKEEAEKIIEIIRERAEKGDRLLVILDDAYFGLVYENGVYNESLFSKLAGVHENVLAVKTDGATKEDYVWGFRVGFITYGIKKGNKELYNALENKTAGAVRGNISNASHLSQSLVLNAFTSQAYNSEKRQKFEILKSRYVKVKEVLSDNKFAEYFKPLPYNSGYFMCIELEPGLDAEKIRKTLLGKYDTGVITFGNIIRIAFSSVSQDKIEKLFENIYNACKEQI